jgi:hypothetical protein
MQKSQNCKNRKNMRTVNSRRCYISHSFLTQIYIILFTFSRQEPFCSLTSYADSMKPCLMLTYSPYKTKILFKIKLFQVTQTQLKFALIFPDSDVVDHFLIWMMVSHGLPSLYGFSFPLSNVNHVSDSHKIVIQRAILFSNFSGCFVVGFGTV